jgi:peptide deformylase
MTVTKLKVRLYGDPCLRKKATFVKDVGPSERILIQAMLSTMYHEKGVGLAAPQVGIDQRIFVADPGEGPCVFINLEILKTYGSGVLEEGCLSIPGINVDVTRPEKVRVRFIDENNDEYEAVFEGLMARVVLHENDHLDGKLIVDYASKEEKKRIAPKLEDLEKKFHKKK